MEDPYDQSDLCECQCPVCGIVFALTISYQNLRKRDHNAFYCPNGHKINFLSKEDEDPIFSKLKDKVAFLETQNDKLLAELEDLKSSKKKGLFC